MYYNNNKNDNIRNFCSNSTFRMKLSDNSDYLSELCPLKNGPLKIGNVPNMENILKGFIKFFLLILQYLK